MINPCAVFHSTRRLFFLQLQALLLCLLLGNVAVVADGRNILVLGDSLSAAYGMDEEQGWVTLLEQRLQQEGLDYQVINASISGETSSGGVGRLPKLLSRHQPEVVILELGGNDGLRGYPVTTLQAQLQQAIDLSRQHSARVLLAGMQIPPNYGPRYSRLFRDTYSQLASDNDVALIPFFLTGVATREELMQADGIHPTAEAQAQILANTWPYLLPLLTATETD